MNFVENFDNLKVPEENIPELLEMAGQQPEFMEKVVAAAGNANKYSVANTKTTASNLENKQIAFLGSSVTYGAASLGESFVDFLRKKDNIFVFKEAVSGTTLTDLNEDSYVGRLTKLPALENLDAFVLQLSTNDAKNLHRELGKISQDDDEKFDITTVTGAIEYILDYVKKTWDCPVLVFSNPHFDSDFYGQMVEQTKRLRDKWGFTFLNLWDNENFQFTDDHQKKLYMFDDIHPTRAGYKEIWLPEFEEALLRIDERQRNK